MIDGFTEDEIDEMTELAVRIDIGDRAAVDEFISLIGRALIREFMHYVVAPKLIDALTSGESQRGGEV